MKYSSVLFLSISVASFQRNFQSKTKILTGYRNRLRITRNNDSCQDTKNPKETGSTIRIINCHKEIESECTHFTLRISTLCKAPC